MKVAISSTGKTLEDNVDGRMGRCPFFIFAEIEEGKIKDFKAVENQGAMQAGGAGITAGQAIANEKVDAVITVNVGPRAFDVFNQFGIKIYRGEGKIKDVVQDFIDNKLVEVSNPTGPQHMGMK
jgi:predicted Fe-Mo cluster-binding NifX family protein